MKTLKLKPFFFVMLILFFACNKEIVKNDTQQYEGEIYNPTIILDVKKPAAWIRVNYQNEKRFNITAEIKIKKSPDYDLKKIKVKEVNVFQNKNLLFSILPFQKLKTQTTEYKIIQFATLQGVSLVPSLNLKKTLMFEIICTDGNSDFHYRIDNIKIVE